MMHMLKLFKHILQGKDSCSWACRVRPLAWLTACGVATVMTNHEYGPHSPGAQTARPVNLWPALHEVLTRESHSQGCTHIGLQVQQMMVWRMLAGLKYMTVIVNVGVLSVCLQETAMCV